MSLKMPLYRTYPNWKPLLICILCMLSICIYTVPCAAAMTADARVTSHTRSPVQTTTTPPVSPQSTSTPQGNTLLSVYDAREDDKVERDALFAIYDAFQGDKWDMWPSRNFPNVSICEWTFVACRTMDDGKPHVIELSFFFPYVLPSSVRTHIPSAMKNLTYLQTYNSYRVQKYLASLVQLPLDYIAPDAFSSLKHLKSFTLEHTTLTNMDHIFPPSIEYILLHDNPITSIKGLEELPLLSEFHIERMPGIFESGYFKWQNMKNLAGLTLRNSDLSALCEEEARNPTPYGQDSVCPMPQSLGQLDVSGNQLTALPDLSLLPRFDGSVNSHAFLDYGYNHIPYFREVFCNVQDATLFPNPIADLPDCFANMTMSFLRISSPVMTEIPRVIGQLQYTDHLFISDMPQLQYIPKEVFDAKSLIIVSVTDAPMLKELPDLSLARGIRNITFDRVGVETWDLTDPDKYSFVPQFSIVNSPLKEVVGTDQVPDVNWCWRVFTGASISLRNCSITSWNAVEVGFCFSHVDHLDLSYNPLRGEGQFWSKYFLNVSHTELEYAIIHATLIDASFIPTQPGMVLDSYGDGYQALRIEMYGWNMVNQPYFIINASYTGFSMRDSYPTVDLPDGLTCYPVFMGYLSIAPDFSYRIFLDPDQLNYEHCRCTAPQMYFVDASSSSSSLEAAEERPSRCEYLDPALTSVLTLAYNDSVRRPMSYVNEGYYPVRLHSNAGSDLELRYCDEGAGSLHKCKFVQCLFPSRCNPHRVSPFKCSGGYSDSSLLCSECPPDAYDLASGCASCPDHAAVWVSIYIILAAVALFVYLWFAHSQDFSHRHSYSSVSIFVDWIQILYILMTILHTHTEGDEFSDSTSVSIMSELAGLFYHIQPPSLTCVVQDYHYISQWWVTTVSPLIISAAVAVIFMSVHFSQGPSSYLLSYIVYCYVFLMQSVYISVSSRVFQVFNCVDFGLGSLEYLSIHPSLSCASDKYGHMKWMGVAGIFLYVLGIPLVLAALIYYGNTKRLNDQSLLSDQSRRLSSLLGDIPAREPSTVLSPQRALNTTPPAAGSRSSSRVVNVQHRDDMTDSSCSDSDDSDAEMNMIERNFGSGGNAPLIYVLPSPFLSASYRMLASPYHRNMTYWTIASLMLRKCLVVAIVSLFQVREAAIPFLILIVLMMSLFVHIQIHPYYHTFDNTLQTMCLILSGITFMSGLFLSSDHMLNPSRIVSAVFMLNIIAFISFVLVVPLLRYGLCPTWLVRIIAPPRKVNLKRRWS